MSETLDWNAKTIAEFRANEGRVGGTFEGAPRDIIYVFATRGGAPTNPDWYHNLTVTGGGSVERGTETYKVTVPELTARLRFSRKLVGAALAVPPSKVRHGKRT